MQSRDTHVCLVRLLLVLGALSAAQGSSSHSTFCIYSGSFLAIGTHGNLAFRQTSHYSVAVFRSLVVIGLEHYWSTSRSRDPGQMRYSNKYTSFDIFYLDSGPRFVSLPSIDQSVSRLPIAIPDATMLPALPVEMIFTVTSSCSYHCAVSFCVYLMDLYSILTFFVYSRLPTRNKQQ